MSLYYNHESLTGDALHYSKILDIASGNSLPTPEFEGQLVSQGNFIYIARGTPLAWSQIQGATIGTLPTNVVTYSSGAYAPPATTGDGKIFVNTVTKEVFFLVASVWKKISAGGGGSTFCEGKVIGSNIPPAGAANFNALKVISPDQENGLVISQKPERFNGARYEIYPSWSAGQLWGGGTTPVISIPTNTTDYLGFTIPRDPYWMGPEDNADHFYIFINGGTGIKQKCYFNYSDSARIIKILGRIT